MKPKLTFAYSSADDVIVLHPNPALKRIVAGLHTTIDAFMHDPEVRRVAEREDEEILREWEIAARAISKIANAKSATITISPLEAHLLIVLACATAVHEHRASRSTGDLRSLLMGFAQFTPCVLERGDWPDPSTLDINHLPVHLYRWFEEIRTSAEAHADPILPMIVALQMHEYLSPRRGFDAGLDHLLGELAAVTETLRYSLGCIQEDEVDFSNDTSHSDFNVNHQYIPGSDLIEIRATEAVRGLIAEILPCVRQYSRLESAREAAARVNSGFPAQWDLGVDTLDALAFIPTQSLLLSDLAVHLAQEILCLATLNLDPDDPLLPKMKRCIVVLAHLVPCRISTRELPALSEVRIARQMPQDVRSTYEHLNRSDAEQTRIPLLQAFRLSEYLVSSVRTNHMAVRQLTRELLEKTNHFRVVCRRLCMPLSELGTT